VNEITALLEAYRRFVTLPWDQGLSGAERVWFALYSPRDERRLRLRLPEFGVATQAAGHGWRHCDVTGLFAKWMAGQEYRESYFENPEDMALVLEEDFGAHVTAFVRRAVEAEGVGADTVIGVSGVASLFGLTSVSKVVASVAPAVRGRLLVFFPGEHDNGSYRLLNARDGWNYLATPISA
jgi:hypothetical protein